MTNFEKSLNKLKLIEGGYSNDPKDKGGETYRGISRVYNPNWKGWKLIDQCKELFPTTFKHELDKIKTLQLHVKELYKEKYWNVFKGDKILSDKVADRLFNIFVHIGDLTFTVTSLQKVLNSLHRGSVGHDLVIDGILGGKTINMLNFMCAYAHSSYKDRALESYIVKGLRAYQAVYYMENAIENPEKRVFTKGFLNRAFK